VGAVNNLKHKMNSKMAKKEEGSSEAVNLNEVTAV